ncbi:DUF3889 domain-containing protein [Fictibacillus nanhaiensis]|uniref:DUF3889 domain-containing protein n=1 Tax=Fictibacillus nanhaiensis TaxID=742169 RepID=A0ABS2ZT21_9BACL|nr:DUF3889 domain-containing protein [Fictibacillus nanhaiensis]
MKILNKLFCFMVAVFLVCSSLPVKISAENPRVQEPAYAKWGRLAVFETGKRYPDYDIIDYLYVGRTTLQNGDNVERFKLWIRKGATEKGVVITIMLTPSGAFKNISFQETVR